MRPLLVGCGYCILFVALACRVLGWESGLGAYVWYELNGQDHLLGALGLRAMPTEIAESGLSAYLEIGFWWGVVVCVIGIRRSGCPGSVRRRLARVAAGNLGLVLSLLWPLQVSAVAVFCLRRAGQHRARRAVTAAVGALALVGGSWWGYTGLAPLQPWTDTRWSPALTGEWHGSDGETLVLRRNGTFSAAGFPPGIWSPTPDLNDTDRWTIRAEDGSALLHLDALPASASGEPLELEVFGFPSPSRLCLYGGPDDPCDPAFHR
ncbi:hypothetical protein [Streptomyces sp. NPDC004533]|uniref:hypothetical protein n=1 Tax=unclassified Streptomyces TaxID=2593676 RepID=UPI0033BBC334